MENIRHDMHQLPDCHLARAARQRRRLDLRRSVLSAMVFAAVFALGVLVTYVVTLTLWR